MIFIERNYGLLPAWIENLTGKNIDTWLLLLSEQKKRAARWPVWEYFILFMQGLDSYDKLQKNGGFCLYEKDGKKGLYRITLNASHAELLYGVEIVGNRITLKGKDGVTAFSGAYAVNLCVGYDGDGVSILPFCDAQGRMAVFDGCGLFYFNINSSVTEPRYELKDGEVNLLKGLGSDLPILDIARSFKEKNNFADKNQLINAFWQKFEEEKKYETERGLLLLIDRGKMQGLSHSFDFYLSEIGFTFIWENSYSKALPYFEEALSINPSGIGSTGQSYNYSCGLALYSIGTPENWNKAIRYLDKAMEVTRAKPQPLVLKGFCLHKLNNYNEAIACLTMSLDYKTNTLTDAEKGNVLVTRAMCYNALGMKDRANKDNTEAEHLAKPSDAAARPVAPSAEKFCGDCGAKLEPGETFCGDCGSKVE